MLPVEFVDMMQQQLGAQAPLLFRALEEEPVTSIRLNDKIDELSFDADIDEVKDDEVAVESDEEASMDYSEEIQELIKKAVESSATARTRIFRVLQIDSEQLTVPVTETNGMITDQ